MLTDTLSITYNGVARTMKRVKESNYSAEYYFRANDLSLTFQVGHVVPPTGKTAEQHAMTLHVNEYDVNGKQTVGFHVLHRVVNREGYVHDNAKMLSALGGLATLIAAIDQDVLDRQS